MWHFKIENKMNENDRIIKCVAVSLCIFCWWKLQSR